jgi:hypothetical protein
MTSQPDADPRDGVDHLILDSVDNIRNRFGATGLRQLIAVAQDELSDTEAALKEFDDEDSAD